MRPYLEHILDPLLERSTGQKLLIVGGLTALQIIVYYAVLYGPQTLRIESLSKRVAVSRARASEQAALLLQRPELEAELAALDDQLRKSAARLPEPDETAFVLATITDTAHAAELSVLALRPREEQIREFYVEVSVDITLVGSYQELFDFLQKLARLEKPLHVTQIQVSRPANEGSGNELRTSARITAWRQLSDEGQETLQDTKQAGGRL